MNSVSSVLASDNFVGAFNGVTGSLLLGLASILLSLCIALIPFLARRIVEGDVGKTMTAVVSTTMLRSEVLGPCSRVKVERQSEAPRDGDHAIGGR